MSLQKIKGIISKVLLTFLIIKKTHQHTFFPIKFKGPSPNSETYKKIKGMLVTFYL
jgi:hypothetical protein